MRQLVLMILCWVVDREMLSEATDSVVNQALHDGKKALKMVHLLYRHGARSPVHFYPSNPIQEDDWPDGAGRLTQIGMQLEYNLGNFLKERYVQNMSFIQPQYLHKEIYIRSSNVERCLQSAETQLAGLYPPQGRQVWNKDINWQPVPVHTVPEDQDPVLVSDDTVCPRRDEIWEKKKSSAPYKEKEEQYKELFSYLTKHAGMDVTMENAYYLSDDYLCEKRQGFSSPQWLLDRWDDILAVTNWQFLYKFSGTGDELGRLLGGTLLGMIVDGMNAMKAGKDSELYKMNIFSGHDTSILSLTSALNINLGIQPTFAACFIIELYADDKSNEYFVELKYRNDSNNHLTPFTLNGCQYSCPLQQFVSLTKSRVTHNYNEDCGLGGGFLKLNLEYIRLGHFRTVLILALVASVMVVCVLVLLAIRVRRCHRNPRNEKKHMLPDEEELLISEEA